MDRRTFLKTGVGVAGVAIAGPQVARGASPMTLRFAHFAAEDHPANIAAKKFASNVENRTGGEIKINIYPNNALGGPPEQAQQIKPGVSDMGLPTQGQLDKYDTAFAAVMLPFIWDSPQHTFRVLDGPAMAPGSRRWPKSKALSCCAIGNTDFAMSPMSCARSIPPRTSRASSFAPRPNCKFRPRWRRSVQRCKPSHFPNSTWRCRNGWWTERRTQSRLSISINSMKCRNIWRSPVTSTTT